MHKFGIVVASRVDSSRIRNKAFKKINGKTLIEHLLMRCFDSGIPVCLATPEADRDVFKQIENRFASIGLKTFHGCDDDPLLRLTGAAELHGYENVIRICHDKILVDPGLINTACEIFEKKNLDYLYSSQFTPGSGFEIISTQMLRKASAKYTNVEHVSYAIKNLTTNVYNMPLCAPLGASISVYNPTRNDVRFLIDYPEDMTFMETVFAACGNDVTLEQAISFVSENPWIKKINRLPRVSVYTCAYNAERFIEKCIGSVAQQTGFKDMEYILVDDHSTDKTPLIMAEISTKFPNIKFVRNPMNLGLSSSSNVALSEARGNYIMRLDADDYLVSNTAVESLLTEISESGKDAIYPNNYFGSTSKIQNGKDHHHVGGAMFRRSAVNHVKFTERLRGYEGYDFFVRAKDQINIGYYGKPTFFYRQRKDSMSKTNLAERAKIRSEIEART